MKKEADEQKEQENEVSKFIRELWGQSEKYLGVSPEKEAQSKMEKIYE